MAMSVSELIGRIINPRPVAVKSPAPRTVTLSEQRLDVLLHRTISAPLQAPVTVEPIAADAPAAPAEPARVSAAD